MRDFHYYAPTEVAFGKEAEEQEEARRQFRVL